MSEREYVISLHDYNELDSFYQDMETSGGNLYIPGRAVPVHNRRPISRNTHYLLTDEEATLIRSDPRVLAVELSIGEQGLEFGSSWSQTSSFWNKSNLVSNTNTYVNWALLRCTAGAQIANWGSNGTVNQVSTVKTTSSGQGVDIVMVDGHMDPTHPEFASNFIGTGPSRVVQFNWFSLNPLVNGTAAGNYVYAPYVDPLYPDNNGDGLSDRNTDNDHGCHTTGTAAGSSQGWARGASIYNFSPYATNPSYTPYYMDYIRAWHRTKAANQYTGIKPPTISNHSYGLFRQANITNITTVVYQGVTHTGPFTANQLQAFGIYSTGGFTRTPVRNSSVEIDFQDAINDGIIIVGAAGNEYTKISSPSSNLADDYNNYFIESGVGIWYYNRGTITAATNVITVGAINMLVNEAKTAFSNCGPRVDIYAPGDYIMSSINSSDGVYATDQRNTAYHQAKYSGTSMAAPQVTGVIACLAETWPNITQAQALAHLIKHSQLGQMTATSGGPTDFTDLQGSANRYLYYYKERPETGQVYPKVNQGTRQPIGMLYPRAKIYRYGR